MHKKSLGDKVFDVSNIGFLLLLSLITLYPFWYVLVESVLPYSESIKSNFHLFPTQISWESYKYVFADPLTVNSFVVTVMVTVVGTALSLLTTTMIAYALSKSDLPGKNLMLTLIIITMFFSGGLIPYYFLVKNLGFIDTWAVQIFNLSFISTFNVIVVKTFIQTLPDEIEESAKVDGAGYFRVFFQIVLAMCVPVLATIGLFIAVQYWNNWFAPMLFVNSKEKWPLALVLRAILIENDIDTANSSYQSTEYLLSESVKMATVIISVIPIIAVYPFIQRYFVKGMLLGAVKS